MYSFRMSRILEEDYKHIAERGFLECFKNKTVAITGATGTIGKYLTGFFIFINSHYSAGVKIFCVGRSQQALTSMFESWGACKELLTFVSADFATRQLSLSDSLVCADIVFHLASYGSPEKFKRPLQTALPNIYGTEAVLEAMHPEAILFFASTTGVYGENISEVPFTENGRFGSLDCHHPISPYLESKRCGEMLISAWGQERKTRFRIGRLSICFGPGISKNDGRLFSDLCYAAAEGVEFLSESDGEGIRNFTYTRDCLIGIFLMIFRGKEGGVYNLASATGIRVGTLVDAIRDRYRFSVRPKDSRRVVTPRFEARDSGVSIDALVDLGWDRCFDNEGAFIRTIEYLRSVSSGHDGHEGYS